MANWYLIAMFDHEDPYYRKYYPRIHPAWGYALQEAMPEGFAELFGDVSGDWAKLRALGTLRNKLSPEDPARPRLGVYDLKLDEEATVTDLKEALVRPDVAAFIAECKGACMLELVN